MPPLNQKNLFTRIRILLILAISLLITSTAGIAREPSEYDTNRNNLLDDTEFFTAVDEWIEGAIDNPSFFEVLDLWVNETPLAIAPPIPSPPPQPPQNTCPTPTRLITLRNGIPSGSLTRAAPDQGFSQPIDSGFASAVRLPQGATIELNISSNMPGLEPRNGTLRSPFIPSRFFNLGPLTIVGNGTIREDVTVPRNFEWASFTPFWTDDTTNGTFTARASVRAPGCPNISMSGSVNLSRIGAAIGNNPLQIEQTAHAIRFSAMGESRVQISIYSLNGKVVFSSPFESEVIISTFSANQSLSNGTYFYVSMIEDVDGSIVLLKPNKLIVLR